MKTNIQRLGDTSLEEEVHNKAEKGYDDGSEACKSVEEGLEASA